MRIPSTSSPEDLSKVPETFPISRRVLFREAEGNYPPPNSVSNTNVFEESLYCVRDGGVGAPITVLLRVVQVQINEDDGSTIPPKGKTRGAILCVHGFSQSRFTWHVIGNTPHAHDRSMLQYLAREGFDVFACDLRGTKDSLQLGAQAPNNGVIDYIEHDFPNMLRLIEKLSGHEKCFLIGHSLGGALVAILGGTQHNRVAGVITLAGAHRLGGWRNHKEEQTVLYEDEVTENLGYRVFPRATSFAWEIFYNIPGRAYLAKTLPSTLPLPTRMIGNPLSVLSNHSMLGKILPIQVMAPQSMESKLVYRWRNASFENTPAGVFKFLDEMLGSGSGMKHIDGTCLFHNFEQLDKMPILCLAGKSDSLVYAQDSAQAYHRSVSKDKTLCIFGGKLGQDISENIQLLTSDIDSIQRNDFGHMDIVIGDLAPKLVWPVISNWIKQRSHVEKQDFTNHLSQGEAKIAHFLRSKL